MTEPKPTEIPPDGMHWNVVKVRDGLYKWVLRPNKRQPSMPKQGIMTAQYEAMLSVFRDEPGNWVLAARKSGLSKRHAQRAWEDGWPRYHQRPIREVVAEEIAEARRRLMSESEERISLIAEQRAKQLTLEQEKKYNQDQRVREGRLAGVSRDNALALEGILANCLRGVIELSKQIADWIASGKVTPEKGVVLIERLSRAVNQANMAGLRAIEIEHLRNGLPTSIVGIAAGATMTTDKAVEIIQRATSTLSRAKELGIVVLPGGTKAAAPGSPKVEVGGSFGQPILATVPGGAGGRTG